MGPLLEQRESETLLGLYPMSRRRVPLKGFTLLELLLVVTIVAILAATVLPNAQSTAYEQLRSTGQIVATDLAYARSLAVANDSKYKITFDFAKNRYVLKHNGTKASLTTLPTTPFSSPGDTSDSHIVDLDDLPHVGMTVRLAAAATSGSTMEKASAVEFGPLGQTTSSEKTIVWLATGSGAAARYITLEIQPATGLVQVGDFTDDGPPAAMIP
jgi:prepilin-type N-terminal cleavage/methylation domain-containing protein